MDLKNNNMNNDNQFNNFEEKNNSDLFSNQYFEELEYQKQKNLEFKNIRNEKDLKKDFKNDLSFFKKINIFSKEFHQELMQDFKEKEMNKDISKSLNKQKISLSFDHFLDLETLRKKNETERKINELKLENKYDFNNIENENLNSNLNSNSRIKAFNLKSKFNQKKELRNLKNLKKTSNEINGYKFEKYNENLEEREVLNNKKEIFKILPLILIIIFAILSAIIFYVNLKDKQIDKTGKSINELLEKDLFIYTSVENSLRKNNLIFETRVEKYNEIYKVDSGSSVIYINSLDGTGNIIDKNTNELKEEKNMQISEFLIYEDPFKEFGFFEKMKIRVLNEEESKEELDRISEIAKSKNIVIDMEEYKLRNDIETLKTENITLVRFKEGLPIVVYSNESFNNEKENNKDENKEEFAQAGAVFDMEDEGIIYYHHEKPYEDFSLEMPDLLEYNFIGNNEENLDNLIPE